MGRSFFVKRPLPEARPGWLLEPLSNVRPR